MVEFTHVTHTPNAPLLPWGNETDFLKEDNFARLLSCCLPLKTFVGKQHSHMECFVLLYFLLTWPLPWGLEVLAFCGGQAAWFTHGLPGSFQIWKEEQASPFPTMAQRETL